jgi:hypothetical protein
MFHQFKSVNPFIMIAILPCFALANLSILRDFSPWAQKDV